MLFPCCFSLVILDETADLPLKTWEFDAKRFRRSFLINCEKEKEQEHHGQNNYCSGSQKGSLGARNTAPQSMASRYSTRGNRGRRRCLSRRIRRLVAGFWRITIHVPARQSGISRAFIVLHGTYRAFVLPDSFTPVCGTAPSAELLDLWNARERALCAEEGTPTQKTLCGCLHMRPLACLQAELMESTQKSKTSDLIQS